MIKKKIIFAIKVVFLLMLLCTDVVFAETDIEKNDIKLKDLSLNTDNDNIIVGENQANVFNIELEGFGEVPAEYITMYARNVNDENQFLHITLIHNNTIMHVRDILTNTPVTNGEYYISDVYINSGLSDIKIVNEASFSKNYKENGYLPLEFDLKFNLIGEKSPVELIDLSLIGFDDKVEYGENLINKFNVGISTTENIESIILYAKNMRDEKQIAYITISNGNMTINSQITKNPLTNGTYYISDVLINSDVPDSLACVRYTKDQSIDGTMPLNFYLEFELEVEKENIEQTDEIVENEIVENTNEILESENINGTNIVKNSILDSELPSPPEGVKELSINSNLVAMIVIGFLMICIVTLVVVKILPRIKKKK